jgi:transposase
LRARLTAGQRHDSTPAEAVRAGCTFQRVSADRGSAGAAFVAPVRALGGEAVIPPPPSAKVQRADDAWRDRERHLVDCCLNKLKHVRRLFSRFDKLDRSDVGFVHFVCALVWLR